MKFELNGKITKCKTCGDKIANLKGLPPETECGRCADLREYKERTLKEMAPTEGMNNTHWIQILEIVGKICEKYPHASPISLMKDARELFESGKAKNLWQSFELLALEYDVQ